MSILCLAEKYIPMPSIIRETKFIIAGISFLSTPVKYPLKEDVIKPNIKDNETMKNTVGADGESL